jgi:hypothetical protein
MVHSGGHRRTRKTRIVSIAESADDGSECDTEGGVLRPLVVPAPLIAVWRQENTPEALAALNHDCVIVPGDGHRGPMRIFFHLADGNATIIDRQGVEVDSLDEIQNTVMHDIEELKREFPAAERQGWKLDVVDAAGTLILSVPLDDQLH